MAPEPKVSILITARDAVTKVIDGVKAKLTSFGKSVRSTLSGINGVLAGLGIALSGAALGAFFKRSIEEATGAERAQLQLRDAVQRTGLSYDALAPKITAYVDAQARAAALDNDDVSMALATLVTRSRDLDGSMTHLNATIGLAAKEHMTLQAAADIVGRAMNGNLRGLKALGINTKDTTAALAQLRVQYGGFAEQEALTFEGALRRLTVAKGDLLEAIGKILMQSPSVRAALNAVTSAAETAGDRIPELAKDLEVFIGHVRLGVAYYKAAGTLLVGGATVLAGSLVGLLARVGLYANEAILFAMQAIDRFGALIGRLPGVGKAIGFRLDLTGATKEVALFRAGVQKTNDAVEQSAFAIREAFEQIGDAQLKLALAKRRPIPPVPEVTGGPSGGGGAGRGGGGGGGGAGDDKTQKQADATRAREIAGLLELLRLRELNAVGVQRLATLQAELTHEVDRERAAVDAGRGSYERLAALEKQRRDLAGAVNAVLDEQRAKELGTLTQLVELRKIDGEGLGRLLELQRELTAQVTEETQRVKEGVGDRERLVALMKEQAELERSLGGKPLAVRRGTLGPTPAPRIDVNARDQGVLDAAVPEVRGDWAQAIIDGYNGIDEAAQRANGQTLTFGSSLLNLAGGALAAFEQAGLAAFEQIGNGGNAMAKAFATAIRSGIAQAAAAKGRFYFFEGTAMLAAGLFPPNPAALASSAKYFAASAGMFALANLAGGSGGGGARGGSGGSGGSTLPGGIGGLGGESGRGSITVYMPAGASVFDPSDPRMVELWAKMLGEISDREVVLVAGGRPR